MKQVLIFIYHLFLLSCVNRSGESISQMGVDKKKYVELAKVEIYKLNAGNDCDCTAIIDRQREGRDTVNIFSLDLKLDTFTVSADTVFYYFSFWRQDISEVAEVFTPGKTFPECAYYYAVGYIGDSSKPFKALIAESSYSLYGVEIDEEKLDFNFNNCLTKNRAILNEWLKKYIKIKNE